ncbi:MAG: anthranilate synthase component I family protein [Deltaproteobacteria bacterium]|jgi:anthranilate synthase component 1|nr:anthranilate synthase component I family protein [Deltaproteobacteria bacterium]
MIVLRQKASFMESDVATPTSVFLNRVGSTGAGILLESAEVGGRWGRHSLICQGILMSLSCREGLLDLQTDDERLVELKKYNGLSFLEGLRAVQKELTIEPDPSFSEFPAITRALYGYLGYGLAGLMEKSLAPYLKPHKAEAYLILPSKVYLFDHAYNRLAELDLEGRPLEVTVKPAPSHETLDLKITPSRDGYMGLVSEGRRLVAQGELIQLVLSVGFEKPFDGSPFEVFRRLRRLNPSPYMFYLQAPDLSLVVSSPEVMVSCHQNRLKLCPIAGTRPRGHDASADDLFETELSADPKEQSEHVMLVDLGRNDLGRVASPGSVVVERYMEVERFSHVMHLTSHLGADLAPGLDAIDVISATFPPGTLTGAPKIKAMELISRLEGIDRGPYGGASGWLGLDKDSVNLDFGITIRSLWVREGIAAWRAGAGVVYDSAPEREWQECLNKARAVQVALDEVLADELAGAKNAVKA